MRITSLKIANFKRFGSLELELGNFDCLVGGNNSGKTTLLQALALLGFCIQNGLSKKNGGPIEITPRTRPQDEFYVVPIASPNDLWTHKQLRQKKSELAIQVEAAFETGQTVTAEVTFRYNRYGIAITSSDESQDFLRELADFRVAFLPIFSAFLPREPRSYPAVIDAAVARGQINSVMRNVLLELKKSEGTNELEQILRRAFPSLEELKIEFDELGDTSISVSYREAGAPKEFDLFSSGSGFQQFVYLFGFILLKQPKLILLDEPDVHLHGRLQEALHRELHRLVEDGKQILFATHSRELIARMDPHQIVSLEGELPSRLRVPFDIYDTLRELGSFDPTQLPTLQAYRRVLLVEGKEDKEYLNIFGRTILGEQNWAEVIRRLTICYANGNPLDKDVETLQGQLRQILALTGHPLRFFVVADRDYRPDRDELLNQKNNTGTNTVWHIWDRNEAENYLLCEAALERLLIPDQEIILAPELREKFGSLMEASRGDVQDQLVRSFKRFSQWNGKGWDDTRCSREARKYLEENWASQRIALTDAKQVIAGLRGWGQEQSLNSFSNSRLAETLTREEIPEEVHAVIDKIAEFSGARIGDTSRASRRTTPRER